jgi:hypothetical protein
LQLYRDKAGGRRPAPQFVYLAPDGGVGGVVLGNRGMSEWGKAEPAGTAGEGFVPKPDVAARLRDALGVLEAIEAGELVAGSPPHPGDRRRHDAGLAALSMLERDLGRLLSEVRAYEELTPSLQADEGPGRRSAATPRPRGD